MKYLTKFHAGTKIKKCIDKIVNKRKNKQSFKAFFPTPFLP